MLTKCIIGEQDIIPCHISRHGIRPVKHAHFYEYQGFTVPDIYGVTSFNSFEIPFWMMILTNQGLNCIFGTINWRIRYFFHQRRQRTTMIYFAVITYDEINRIQIDFRFQIINELGGMRFPHSIDEDSLLLFNQVRILAGTIINAVVRAVEFLQFPVDFANPRNIIFNVLSHNNLHVL